MPQRAPSQSRVLTLLLGALALVLAVALAVVLLTDEDGGAESGSAQAPSTRTVSAPAPGVRGGTVRSAASTGTPAALRSGSGLVAKTGSQTGRPAFIAVTVEGQTGEWNGQARAYLASSSFRRHGTLIVQPDGDFGLLAGGLAEDTAGRIAFVTNTRVFQWVRGISASLWAASIPAATVTVDRARGVLQAVVGGPLARVVVNNNFNVRPGLVSPRTITAGRAELRFAAGRVNGVVELYGGGYIEPGNSFPVNVYRAVIAG